MDRIRKDTALLLEAYHNNLISGRELMDLYYEGRSAIHLEKR